MAKEVYDDDCNIIVGGCEANSVKYYTRLDMCLEEDGDSELWVSWDGVISY